TVDPEVLIVGNGQADHLQAVGRLRDRTAGLAPGVAGRHKPHFVETELLAGRLGHHQVAGMDGVERPTENPDLHPTHSSWTPPTRIGSLGRAPARRIKRSKPWRLRRSWSSSSAASPPIPSLVAASIACSPLTTKMPPSSTTSSRSRPLGLRTGSRRTLSA